jgi:hypothetical protein
VKLILIFIFYQLRFENRAAHGERAAPLGGGRVAAPLGGGRAAVRCPLSGAACPPLGGGRVAAPLGGGRVAAPLGGGRAPVRRRGRAAAANLCSPRTGVPMNVAPIPHRPPPPHDPLERVLVTRIDGWQVRDFAHDDERLAYFAAHGFSHLQLWNPARGVSVLTPSRLTDGRFEAFPIAGWKQRADDWLALATLLRATHGLVPPGPACLRAVERWFLRPDAPELSGPDAA